jgi:acetyl esterase/lipase
MHADFKRLASLRKFMMRGDPRDAPDFGRDLAAQWISRQGLALPDDITISKTPTGREITPTGPAPDQLIIYIHGGGLVYYDTSVFTPFLAQLSHQLGIRVVALDYPKAPEVSVTDIFATLLDQVQGVIAANPNCDVILAGDSVGGLLAMQLAQTLQAPRIKNLHLIYPVTDNRIATDCPFGTGHFLDSSMMDWFYTFIEPLFDGETTTHHLPPTTVHIAQNDILAAQGQAFANFLKSKNRLKDCHVYAGLPHDFCLFAGASDAAKSAVRQIGKSMMETVDA